MVHGDTLPSMQLVLRKSSLFILDNGGDFAWSGACLLLPIFTGSTHWWMCGLGRSSVKTPSLFGVSKNAGEHEKLNFLQAEMAKTFMPFHKLLLRRSEVDVGMVNCVDGSSKSLRGGCGCFTMVAE